MFLVNTFQNAHSALSPLANESPSLVVGRPATMGAVASDGMFRKQELLQLVRLEDGIWAVGSSQHLFWLVFSPCISWVAPAQVTCHCTVGWLEAHAILFHLPGTVSHKYFFPLCFHLSFILHFRFIVSFSWLQNEYMLVVKNLEDTKSSSKKISETFTTSTKPPLTHPSNYF